MPLPKLKPEESPDQSDFELEGLADQEKRVEGKKILFFAKEKMAKIDDPEKILEISQTAREKLIALYKGSANERRDLPRFEVALARATKMKAEIGRVPYLIKIPVVDVELKVLKGLHDSKRKNKAAEIFEVNKQLILNSEDKAEMKKIMSIVKEEWEALYKGASDWEKQDLHVLNIEFGIFTIERMRHLKDGK
jgi:hypothetical protein